MQRETGQDIAVVMLGDETEKFGLHAILSADIMHVILRAFAPAMNQPVQ